MMNNVKSFLKNSALSAAIVLSVGGTAVLLNSEPSFAQQVPEDVQNGIDTAKATVEALNPLALAALTVALLPMGAMLTLRFLNMVLSRV